MRKIVMLLIVGFVFTLASCKPIPDEIDSYPMISGISDVTIEYGEVFDPLEGVEASWDESPVYLEYEGEVDSLTPGEYIIIYTATDEFDTDMFVTASRTITVLEPNYELANGFYDYKYMSPEAKLSFLSAAEQYLMEGQVGGINLFTSASKVTFSSRFRPGNDEYMPVMEFDVYHGTMLYDDTTVDFLYDYVGVDGEYTYRTYTSYALSQYNQYIHDTSAEADVMEHMYGALYKFMVNEDENGFEIIPSMASGTPVLQNPSINEYGVEVGDTWLIPIRDDLQWYFHPDAPQAFLDTNPSTSISADDFVDTFKLSMDEQWFRAISGGGDFVSSVSAIKGAQEYIDGTGLWEEVGFDVVTQDGVEYIEVVFVEDQEEFDVMYYYSDFVKTPVHLGLYDYLDSQGEWYGEDYTKVAYHGAFYVDEVVEDKYIHLKENPNYHDIEEYDLTGILFYEIQDFMIRWETFADGYLDVVPLPTVLDNDSYDCCVETWIIPGTTTFRMNVNGFGSEEALQEVFPESDYVPEPILGLEEFKLAMFHAIDRATLANDLLNQSRIPSMYYFSETYMVDWTQGVVYRETSEGQSVGEEMNPATHGYDRTKAIEYYKQAIETLLEDGDILPGTESEYNVIDLELITYTDSVSWDVVAEYIEEQFEQLFVDEENYIRININIVHRDFPALYYDYQMIGEFDLAFGGISGMSYNLHATRHFRSDNKSGFQLNWGIDTSMPEIEVEYIDHLGNYRHEIFSYDAISSILEGEVFLHEGTEFNGPSAEITEVTVDALTVTIPDWNHEAVENVTYTLQTYDYNNHMYVDVEEHIGIQVSQEEFTIVDLQFFNYSNDELGSQIYQGDYQVKIEFNYIGGEETRTQYSNWVELEPLVKETGVRDISTTSFEVPVEINGDSVVDEIELYEKQTDGSYLLVDAVDGIGEALVWTDLEVDTYYVLKIIFDDSEVFYIDFKTHAVE